jgi:two-component system, cell cycle response regulator
MKPKILVVDDSKTIRVAVAGALKTFDCDMFEAANGVEGLAIANREKPDLLLLDVSMPIMEGTEMLSKLRFHPDLKNIPVLMLTSESGRDTVMRIAKLGVRDYLLKPFKEEVLLDRVSRIIDLKQKGDAAARMKRFDDELTVLVVDDKPTIQDQIRQGLADTSWTVEGRTQISDVVEFCVQTLPDVILVSLTLPENDAFTLFQSLRASTRTKKVPVFGLCVKTAIEEQNRAQQSGFTGVITKPIDLDDLKSKISRALNLDTSYKYFERRDGVLVLSLPPNFNPAIANEVLTHLRTKVSEAVDAGLDRMVIDVSKLKHPDVNFVKLGLSALQLCQELTLKQRIIGSEGVLAECKNYEETKDWRFVSSFDEALAALNAAGAAPA